MSKINDTCIICDKPSKLALCDACNANAEKKQKSTLTNLEFVRKDFEQEVIHMGFKNETVRQTYADMLMRVANRILREKLEKADKVYGMRGFNHWVWSPLNLGACEKEARLVDIKEIKK